MTKARIGKLSIFLMLSGPLSAELVAIDDQALSDFSGQAIIAVDNYQVVQANALNTEFTRITLGSKVETNATIDKLEVGKYDRTGSSSDADIDIDNLRLGYIDPVTYEYVPFVIDNPYMEFGFTELNGVKTIAGIRIGAGSVAGVLTANINALTGNLELLIDHDNDVATAPLSAQLLDSTGAATNIRATHVGLPGDCTSDCISLTNLASLNINDGGTAGDMFLSYQNIDMSWATTLNDGSIDTNRLIETVPGAFFNLPTGMTTTTGALIGVPGVGGNIESTRYIDSALGLFP
jgi:hypothetical protein